jgi:endonuclease/exonuclease/phosphatase family metal-dependent hydrolase
MNWLCPGEKRHPSVRRLGVLATAVLLVVIAGCTSNESGDTTDATPLATGESMELDVLVYNIEYGGDASTDKVMRELDADIVGVLESYNRLPEIAAETGYPYYNVALQLLSKYPIHEASGADGLYALIEVQPGHVVAFFNTHLDYVKYGPKLIVNGMSVADAIESENEVRTSSLQIQLPYMKELAEQGYPVFLTGDFNQPSSLDYTEETVGTREGIDEPVAWPVSEELFAIGFRDTYREIFADPVAVPGLTKDNPDFREGGVGDRIDYVYAGGPVETLDSQLVGEKGGPDVDVPFTPWTSDHRAVLSTFELAPVVMPTMVSLDARMLTQGDTLGVFANAPGVDQTEVSIVAADGDIENPVDSATISESTGRAEFDTSDYAPTGYDVVMSDAEGNELARNSFWVRSPEATVSLTTDQPSYASGDPIEVSWTDGPANRWDWIGVYHADAADPRQDDYLLWGYTGGHDSGALPPSVAGSLTLDENSQGQPWPLPPGDYVVHYLLTDQYRTAGYAEFTVTK